MNTRPRCRWRKWRHGAKQLRTCGEPCQVAFLQNRHVLAGLGRLQCLPGAVFFAPTLCKFASLVCRAASAFWPLIALLGGRRQFSAGCSTCQAPILLSRLCKFAPLVRRAASAFWPFRLGEGGRHAADGHAVRPCCACASRCPWSTSTHGGRCRAAVNPADVLGTQVQQGWGRLVAPLQRVRPVV